MPDNVTASREIAASAERVIALVADVTRIGEWSPETRSCVWTGGHAGPKVGATFRGTNRHGWHRWTTSCVVTTADPTHFAFSVSYLGQSVADWDYVATASPAGSCTVVETWTDLRRPMFAKLGAVGTGVKDRREHNRSGMEATLRALAAEAETATV